MITLIFPVLKYITDKKNGEKSFSRTPPNITFRILKNLRSCKA